VKPSTQLVVCGILAVGSVVASGDPYTVENGQIVTVDLWHHTTTAIGGGAHDLSAIELSEDGFLYGIDVYAGTLERIDPATGSSETVGSLGIATDLWLADLDEDATGQLRLLASDENSSRLYSVDRSTGAASLVCQSDVPFLMGLASSGGHTWIGTLVPNPPDPGCGLELVAATTYRTYLDAGPDGLVYALSEFALPSLELTEYVFYRVNPANGSVTVFWDLTTNSTRSFEGFTLDPTEQPPSLHIPTLDWRGAAALALLLAASGAWLLLRRS
jgi:hypothetical protein